MDVVLRDVLEADLPIFFLDQLDPIAHRLAAFAPRDEAEFRAHWARILADPSVAKQTILFEGRVVGNVGSFDRSGRREIGYWIGRDYWGKGIASAALTLFLRHERARPLHALVARHNPASLRVLAKCGFTIVGEGRSAPDTRGPEVEELTLRLDATPGREPC